MVHRLRSRQRVSPLRPPHYHLRGLQPSLPHTSTAQVRFRRRSMTVVAQFRRHSSNFPALSQRLSQQVRSKGWGRDVLEKLDNHRTFAFLLIPVLLLFSMWLIITSPVCFSIWTMDIYPPRHIHGTPPSSFLNFYFPTSHFDIYTTFPTLPFH